MIRTYYHPDKELVYLSIYISFFIPGSLEVVPGEVVGDLRGAVAGSGLDSRLADSFAVP